MPVPDTEGFYTCIRAHGEVFYKFFATPGLFEWKADGLGSEGGFPDSRDALHTFDRTTQWSARPGTAS